MTDKTLHQESNLPTKESECQDHFNRNLTIIMILMIGLGSVAIIGIISSVNEYQSQIDSINAIDHNCFKLKQWIMDHSDYSDQYSGLGKAKTLYGVECK